ncbi:MAG: SseB family protein [Acidimicrobiales bacterium]
MELGVTVLDGVSNGEVVRALCLGDGLALAAAAGAARFLVPARQIRPSETVLATGTGAKRERLVWAFTDLEAFRAWDRHSWPAAAAVSSIDLAGVASQGAAAEADRAAMTPGVVVMNPAGPAATLLSPEQLLPAPAPIPPALRGAPAERLDPSLGAVEARRAPRADALRHHAAGREAVEKGDDRAAVVEFGHAAQICGQLGDRLHGAAVMVELARCRIRLEEVPQAAAILQAAATVLASLGELDLGIDALLDVAELATAEGEAGLAAELAEAALAVVASPELATRLLSVWRGLADVEWGSSRGR